VPYHVDHDFMMHFYWLVRRDIGHSRKHTVRRSCKLSHAIFGSKTVPAAIFESLSLSRPKKSTTIGHLSHWPTWSDRSRHDL